MNDPYLIFYYVAMVLSLLTSLLVIVLTWQRRQAPGTKAMIALAFSTFIWTLGFFLEANSQTLERQLLFNNVGYIGSMSVPVAWFIFAVHYTTGDKLRTPSKVLSFCIIPLATIILVWSNNWHHLMWSNEHLVGSGPFTVTTKTYGTFFWIAMAYNYILIISGAVILIRQLFTGVNLYKGQVVSLLVAVSVPLIWNIIYVFNLLPIPRKDLTPVAFAISGTAIVFGLMRFQLFTAIPFARKFLVQQLSEGVIAIDMQNSLLEANLAALGIFGISESVIGRKIDDISQLSGLLELLERKDPGDIELSLTVSGEVRIYETRNIPMHDDQRQQVGWLILFRDITERKRQELEYRIIIRTMVDGFWITDMGGRFLDVNEAYCKMVGYGLEELLNMRIMDIEAIEVPEETISRIERIKKIGQERFETRHRCKDGTIIDVEVSANYLTIGGERMFVFVRDVTERNRMQSQLIAQDRLASIGELTAGVAHEMNNPLTIVKGYSELLLKKEHDPETTSDLSVISSEVERASKIIDNLLTFAREQPDEKQPVNVNNIIEKTLELRRYEQESRGIETITNLATDLSRVMANEFQLQQVFINIIINAEYFMAETHGKGVLTIATKNSDDSVRISFTDDGPGIPRENTERIFNPFFTTKEVGKGTGLGLSICHGIVTEHKGRIWAENSKNGGAVFIVELPVYRRH